MSSVPWVNSAFICTSNDSRWWALSKTRTCVTLDGGKVCVRTVWTLSGSVRATAERLVLLESSQNVPCKYVANMGQLALVSGRTSKILFSFTALSIMMKAFASTHVWVRARSSCRTCSFRISRRESISWPSSSATRSNQPSVVGTSSTTSCSVSMTLFSALRTVAVSLIL